MLLHSPASPSVCALDKRVGVCHHGWLGVSHLLYVCVRKLSSQRTLLMSSAGHVLVVPNPSGAQCHPNVSQFFDSSISQSDDLELRENRKIHQTFHSDL